MKKNIHPKYQQVLFVDSSTGHKFVCGSALTTQATEEFEGVTYPVCHVSVSSASHPLFTGNKQLIDTEGRVDKFNKRYIAAAARTQNQANKDKDSGGSKEESSKNKQKPAKKKK